MAQGLALVLWLCVPLRLEAGAFPFPVHKKTLANGLDVVVIETPEFKNVLSFNTMVLAGSGHETEKGKTGLAHLFEHILFRHRYAGQEGGYDDRMSRLGTHNNAWTTFDVTYYHPLTFTSNLQGRPDPTGALPGLLELESARFKGLDFTEKTFKTETGAVLGEYRRWASVPSAKMEERLYAMMFPSHPYGHTTIGYYEDVLDMPNHFEAAKRFYDTFYRPNNCIVVVVGDVRASEMFQWVNRHYKDWQPKPVPEVEVREEAAQGERRDHVGWDADVAPLLWVGYRMPAFKPGTADSAVAELLGELLVSPAAPLYRHLRYETQAASELGLAEGSQGFESFAPRLMILSAQLYKEKYASRSKPYFDEVAAEIIHGVEALRGFSGQTGAGELLRLVQKKYRYDTLAQFDSPEHIGSAFAWYYRFDRDSHVIDTLLHSVESLSPKDIDRFAQTYLVADNRAVLTLAYEPSASSQEKK